MKQIKIDDRIYNYKQYRPYYHLLFRQLLKLLKDGHTVKVYLPLKSKQRSVLDWAYYLFTFMEEQIGSNYKLLTKPIIKDNTTMVGTFAYRFTDL